MTMETIVTMGIEAVAFVWFLSQLDSRVKVVEDKVKTQNVRHENLTGQFSKLNDNINDIKIAIARIEEFLSHDAPSSR